MSGYGKEWKPIDYAAERIRMQLRAKKLVTVTEYRTALRDEARKLGTPRKFTHLIGPLAGKVRAQLRAHYTVKELDGVETKAMAVARKAN